MPLSDDFFCSRLRGCGYFLFNWLHLKDLWYIKMSLYLFSFHRGIPFLIVKFAGYTPSFIIDIPILSNHIFIKYFTSSNITF